MEKPESAAAVAADHLYDKSFIQPSMEKFEPDFIEDNKKVGSLSTSLVSNGCIDFRGKAANKETTGGWKASPFIIVNEVAERLAFFAIAVNMVAYLVFEMQQSLPNAATHGMVLLTVSASVDSLRPPCTARPCNKATDGQTWFLYAALGLIALGTGGIKPCVSSFGADQFDEADKDELLKIEILVLQLVLLWHKYGFIQVIVVSLRNHSRGVEVGGQAVLYEVKTKESDIVGARKLPHTTQYRFLDKAAVVTDLENNQKTRWRLCTVTQVEEFKCFVRVLPIWASTIALSISFAQLSTFFISQAPLTNRQLGPNFVIPAGSVPLFSAINALILVPIYEKWMVPILRRRTGHHRGITSLQRMGVRLFISIFALASAALVEKKRRDHYSKPFSMSVFWLLPQFFLIGAAEVFTYVGQLEFFYDEATDGTRSISSAMFLSEIGIGSWLSTALVKIIESATGGEKKGWLRGTLNKSKLDYFYWILTAINALNFLVYLWVSRRYKSRHGTGISVRDGEEVEN
ncbi:hypothetical protein ACLB2K_015146 [Fragaria x ananassa]